MKVFFSFLFDFGMNSDLDMLLWGSPICSLFLPALHSPTGHDPQLPLKSNELVWGSPKSRTVAGDDKSESVWLWLSCKGRARYLEGPLKQYAADIRALSICGVLQQTVSSMNTHQTLKFKTTHKNTLIHTILQSSVLLTHQANSSHS